MHGKTLKNWRAKRAGGRITVYGTDNDTGEAVKIVAVDEIAPSARVKRFLGSSAAASVIAKDRHGAIHTLLI